jgi:hypothetical protein
MKKIMAALLALLTCLAIVACTSTPKASEPAAEPAKVEPAKAEPAAAENELLFESFEEDLLWSAVGTSWNDGDASIGAYKSEEHATDGDYSLECVFKYTGKNQARFIIDKPDLMDFSPYAAITLDIFNATDQTLPFNICICTGDAWVWQETAGVDLAPGANNGLVFPINKNIKSAASNWAYADPGMTELNKVMRVALSVNIMGIDVSGKVYADNIRLVK